MNVLKSHLRITIETLLTSGVPQREIARRTGVDRKTIRHYARPAAAPPAPTSPGVATGSPGDPEQSPPPRPPAPAGIRTPAAAALTISACEAHRAWIEAQVALGRNAVSIFQDLVEGHGFTHQ